MNSVEKIECIYTLEVVHIARGEKKRRQNGKSFEPHKKEKENEPRFLSIQGSISRSPNIQLEVQIKIVL